MSDQPPVKNARGFLICHWTMSFASYTNTRVSPVMLGSLTRTAFNLTIPPLSWKNLVFKVNPLPWLEQTKEKAGKSRLLISAILMETERFLHFCVLLFSEKDTLEIIPWFCINKNFWWVGRKNLVWSLGTEFWFASPSELIVMSNYVLGFIVITHN